jgi:hypothetical protein
MTTTIIPPRPADTDADATQARCATYGWCDLQHVNERGIAEYGPHYHSQTIVRTIGGHEYDWVLALDEDGPHLYWDQDGYIESRTLEDWDEYVSAVASIRDDFSVFYSRYAAPDETNRLRRDKSVTAKLAEVEN